LPSAASFLRRRAPVSPAGPWALFSQLDVDDAVNLLLEAGEVVFFADAVGLQAGVEVFGVVLGTAGHPGGGFDAGAGDVVVGVLFVVASGIVGDDDVGFEEAEEEDKPLTEFAAGDVVHHVVVVVEVVGFLDAEDAVEGVLVALVGCDGFGVVAGAGHVVVGDADHVGGGAFVDQFGVEAGGEDGDVVRVGLDGDDDLAGAGFAFALLFDDDGAVGIERFTELLGGKGGGKEGEKGAAVHGGIVTRRGGVRAVLLCGYVQRFGAVIRRVGGGRAVEPVGPFGGCGTLAGVRALSRRQDLFG